MFKQYLKHMSWYEVDGIIYHRDGAYSHHLQHRQHVLRLFAKVCKAGIIARLAAKNRSADPVVLCWLVVDVACLP